MADMVVTRFAPSPTGYLHLGHAFAALTAFEAAKASAKSCDGRFVLRIEDIDRSRCRYEYEAAILDDLAWIGLSWEWPCLRQSERFEAYRAALASLNAQGLLYPCFCTRKDIAEEIARAVEAPHGPEGPHYPGTCRALSQEERARNIASGIPYAMRLDVTSAAARAGDLTFEEGGAGPNAERGTIKVEPNLFGDIVLARKDAPAAYHLAVVVDDAFQGVTLVTRGNDLFAATHVQRLLQALLGLPEPAYAHHRLILDEQGKKFSKRDSSVTLRALRERGATPEQTRKLIDF
ncbi:MAG: tRNA glutamyl-Q(34) synthetase GluQRS [Proteobacteria bacterium]|nr:tRNA glutamyl-Q(34) synthetase GluQRS [Pseudomonadota bacterium]